MNKNTLTLTLPLLIAAMTNPLEANVTLPALFSDHMVLQQNTEVTVWGWAKPLEKISVVASWDGVQVKTQADNHANWQVKLKTPTAGGPHTITVSGYNTIVLQDVLIGEVWLCAGQSNMEWSAAVGIDNGAQAISKAWHPRIRLFQVPHKSAPAPQLDCDTEWRACSPQTMQYFSAVGYAFGEHLQENLDVPIGLINSSWGATAAEVWVNADVISANDTLAQSALKLPNEPWCPNEPGSVYNAMIGPLSPYSLAGFIWYQGETNTHNPETYTQLLKTLIRSWRNEFGDKLPFYYVQIAPWKYDARPIGVMVREAQRLAMSTPKTGMVVISDIGNIEELHPRNKLDVGKRLAAWALNKTYGRTDIPYSGPLYRAMEIKGDKIRVYFDHAENGFLVKGNNLTHFEIAGEDSIFVPAQARIKGEYIEVRARQVKKPVAVRFAWSNTAEPNLFNKEGLPASCFRTDDWPIDLTPPAPPHIFVPADNQNIQYWGRWDNSDPAHPRHAWSGTSLTAEFTGTSIGVRLADGDNYYNVYIDGQFHSVFHGNQAVEADYILANDLPNGRHTFRFAKRNFTLNKAHSFAGLILDRGQRLLRPPDKPELRIEFIGDSFTAAEGNEATAENMPWQETFPVTNIDEGFAAIVANYFKADYHIISRSGIGMVCDWKGDFDYALPKFYDRTLLDLEEPKWDFQSWQPHLVVIALGLNDHAGLKDDSSHVSEENSKIFRDGYRDFLKVIREVHPGVKIAAVAPPHDWLYDNVRKVVQAEMAAGHKDIIYAQFDEYPGGYVANGHPTTETHHKIAEQVIDYIESSGILKVKE